MQSREPGRAQPGQDGPTPSPASTIEPVRVNMRAMFLVGTAAWLVGGAVVGVLLATGAATEDGWLAICATGAAIGLAGWRWSVWRRW